MIETEYKHGDADDITLLPSTIAETDMLRTDKKRPNPIRCSMLIPEGCLVILRARGTKTPSYSGTETRMVRPTRPWSEAGERRKWDQDMEAACLVKKVCIWAWTTANIRQKNQMGVRRRTSLASSTWVTVHSRQGFLVLLVASVASITVALSSALHGQLSRYTDARLVHHPHSS